MERKLYLLSPLQAEFYENESDRMYPDDVMDGRALAVYGADSVLTIVHRLMLHENIGLPHRKHLYQIMANELKIPHVAVSLTYMVVQGVVVAGYLVLREYGYVYLAGSILLLSILYLLFMKKFFHLHQF